MNKLMSDVNDLVGKTITNVVTDKNTTTIGLETHDGFVLILIPEEEDDRCGDILYDYIDETTDPSYLDMDQRLELKLISEEEYNNWKEEKKRKEEEREKRKQKEEEERQKLREQEELQELKRLAAKHNKTIQ